MLAPSRRLAEDLGEAVSLPEVAPQLLQELDQDVERARPSRTSP
jgi:hypothetical protein